jgi:molybdenum cofactor biosynthesis protein B
MTAAADFRPLSLCVLTVSDTRSADNDTSGAYLSDALRDAGHRLFERAIVRDDRYRLRALVSRWIADGEVDGILVTGGTGFTGRDSTPRRCCPCSTSTCRLRRTVPRDQLRGDRHLDAAVACVRRAGQRDLPVLPCPARPRPAAPAGKRSSRAQLDARTRPCNLATLRPRLKE